MNNKNLELCINALKKQAIIAYPTESVFSLGCDPDSKKAVIKLLKLKNRSLSKGFILISSNYEYFYPYINKKKISQHYQNMMLSLWSIKNISFAVPASKYVPKWVTGKFKSVVIRITNNYNAKILCKHFGKPIISTSANLSGITPCNNVNEVKIQFGANFPILQGKTNKLNPSEIRDLFTGKIIRKG